MNRLTKWNGNKFVLPQGKGSFRIIAERLAAYENTGLEPDEIAIACDNDIIDEVRLKRVFISGPISDTNDYMERFRAAENLLKSKGFLAVNPTMFSKHLLECEFQWEEFMKITYSLLKQCSKIYMLRGWEQSKGAHREYLYALSQGINVIFEEA